MCRNNSDRGGKKISAENGAWCGVCSPTLFQRRLLSGKYQLIDGVLEKRCGACQDYWPADTEFFFPKTDEGDHMWNICKACFLEKTGRTAEARAAAKLQPVNATC